jgi:rRNA maturation endonuclease Nob1
MGDKISKLKQAITDAIIDDWYWFKVCEGCENVIDTGDAVCPVCKSYRFDENKKRIIERAKVVSDKYCDFISKDSQQ